MSFGIGTSTFGGSLYAAWLGQVAATGPVFVGIEIYVGGVKYKSWVEETLAITQELNARSEAQFALNDRTASVHLKPGQPVRITRDGVLIFAGLVDEVEEHAPDGAESGLLEIAVHCVDWNALADRHLVAAKLATAGQTLRDVVTAILDVHSGDIGERLKDDGVRIDGTVEQGPVLTSVAPDGSLRGVLIFNYQTVTEAYDDLAELVGFWWIIDYEKRLHFRDPKSTRAPVVLDQQVFREFRKVKVTQNLDQYRNVQILRGGKDVTLARTQKFKGDGEQTNFELALPVSEVVSIVKQPGSVSQTFGIREKEQGKNWYYQVDQKGVSQDSGGTKLTTSETLEVTYKGFFPILQKGRADPEIKARKTLEATTGVYEQREEDQEVNDNDLAEEKVAALLRKFARVPRIVEFETPVHGFSPGQLLPANLPEHNLSGDLLVGTVNFGWVGKEGNQDRYEYRVRAVEGEFIGGWADFFRRLTDKQGPRSVRENDQILLLRQLLDVIEITETVTTQAPLGSFLTDVSRGLVGQRGLGGRRQKSVTDTTEDIAWGPMVGEPNHKAVA